MPTSHGSPTEFAAIVGRIKPQTVTAAATVETGAIDAKLFDQFEVTADFGDYAAGNNGSVAVGVYGDTAAGGSFTTLVTGLQIGSSLHTGSDGDDSVALIRVLGSKLADQGFRYFKVKLTPTNQNLTMALTVRGHNARYVPATDFDLAAVKQVIGV